MNRTLSRAVPLVALLAGLVAVPSPAVAAPPGFLLVDAVYVQEPTQVAPAPRPVQSDEQKRIAEIEKQIAELQKKLEELKNGSKSPASLSGTIPASYVEKMNWRCVGPANMGGRATAIAVHPTDSCTYYIATASGGLLKTVNNGTTFVHQFDKQSTVSIGDVAVSPSEPETVWVGTGEANPRNSVSRGDGVYKSTDGGKSWTNMGLKESFQIGKVVIHPKDANTVYVAALGRLYGPNAERGVFKTTDGGKTWTKVLFIDDKHGAIDLRMDPHDPNTLLAAMWERKRDGFDGAFGKASEWPTTDQYGPEVMYSAAGGIYKTADAGKTWKKLNDPKKETGLPTAKTGRIGIDFSAKTKGLVYAIIDTEKQGGGRPVPTVIVGLNVEEEKDGLKVGVVSDDGPAAKAGMKAGDVVVSIDGTKMDSHDTFQTFLATKKADDVVKVVIRRDKKEQTLDVKLAPKAGTGPPLILGIQVESESASGAVGVAAVTPKGPAEAAGIQPGDLITAIAGKTVKDRAEYDDVMSKLKAGEKVKVAVTRGKEKKEVEVTPVVGKQRGGGGPPAPGRPHLRDRTVGGQSENVQGSQGKEGFQTGGVYVSKDGGEKWERVNSLNPRPFYFSVIRVDPTDDNTVYVLGDVPTPVYKSTDGGKKFASLTTARGVHPDAHAMWIDPRDGRHMLIGCDGGFYATFDRGATWDHLNVMALGQFYHVAVDNKKPYHVYGGLQDNGSWGGPSQVLRGSGPVNEDWLFVRGGDGFVCRVDPTDPDLVYSESQGGAIGRRNMRTGETGFIRPQPLKKDEDLRFNWNTPFILSSHNPSIVYVGAQYVFRSFKKGDEMKVISPDLTRTKAGCLSALADSPKNADVLWAGTDDGYLWITQDGGHKWDNLTEKLKAAGVPGPRWVCSIEPSRVKEGRCYVALDGHRSDDDKPYVLVTEDFGQTWKNISANLPPTSWTRVVREDYVNPELLYCGTEFGIWASVNRGGSWTNLNNNLPTVAVHEVAQPTTASEIVVATHGRSVWILDVASLRQMTSDALQAQATLFAPAPATRWKMETGREFPYSVDVRKFYGKNPEWGAGIDYVLNAPAKALSIKVVDVSGTTVWNNDRAPKTVGFHRLNWGLTSSAPAKEGAMGGGFRRGGGSVVPAGEYRVVLTVDGKEYSQKVAVENDPNADPKAIITPGGERRSYLHEGEEEKEEEDMEKEER